MALNFAGIDPLDSYLSYWFATRAVECQWQGYEDEILTCSRMSLRSTTNARTRSVRPSTAAATAACRLKAESIYPENVHSWAIKCHLIERDAALFFGESGKGYKAKLKAKYVSRLLAKNTPIAAAVKELNTRYYELYVLA